jgi:hypothetical protein
MAITRTIYAGKDEIYSRLMIDRDHALEIAASERLPRYRRTYWMGKAEGLQVAARLVRDWAGTEKNRPES